MDDINWPTMPPNKGQSSVLFEDGYAEGWAKCMEACRAAVAALSKPEPVQEREALARARDLLCNTPLLTPAEAVAKLSATPPAQPEPEPLAWMVFWGIGEKRPVYPAYNSKWEAEEAALTIKSETEVRPLYATPLAQAGDAGEPSDGERAVLGRGDKL